MATRNSAGSGRWSEAGTWDTAPVDGDSVVITAGHNVWMDADLSAWTGLGDVTITSHSTTPGMLYWKNDTGPNLRIGTTNTNVRTDRINFIVSGTIYTKAAVDAGTALSGEDIHTGLYGAWALDIGTDGTIDITPATDNGSDVAYTSAALAAAGLPAVAASHIRLGYVTVMNSSEDFHPGIMALDAANNTTAYTSDSTNTFSYGYLKMRTAYHMLGTNAATKGRLLANSDGTWGTTTELEFKSKAIVDMGATTHIDAQYLDIKLYCTNPSATSVRCYGQVFAECTVDATGDTLTYTGLLGGRCIG
jgi:hypothetical protein